MMIDQRLVCRLWRSRRGSVAVTFAILLPALIGFAGLASEVGLWYSIKRQNQAAADEGALGGGLEIVQLLEQGKAPAQSDVQPPATCSVWRNGFDNSVSSPCGTATALTGVTVTYPYTDAITGTPCPTSASNCVEVVLDQSVGAMFASLFLPNGAVIKTRAVAKAGPIGSGRPCVLALDPSHKDALQFSGSTTINLDCPVASNSSDPKGVEANGGNNLNVTVGAMLSNGGYYNTTNAILNITSPPGIPQTFDQTQFQDPYGGVTYPTTIWPATYSTTPQSGAVPAGSYSSSGTTPPLYFQSGANVTLCGTYYTEGSSSSGDGFRIDTGATVQESAGCTSGVTVILTSSDAKTQDAGAINIQGGTVNLTAPTSTPPNLSCPNMPSSSCTGLLFYQDPNYTNPKNKINSTITASSSVTLTGAIVTPTTNVTIIGNSTTNTATSTCTEIIAWQIQITGNSTVLGTSGCGADGVGTAQIYRAFLAE